MIRPLIIMLGLPGSGKGTQGKMLAKDLQMAYLATGDLVREVSRNAQDQFSLSVKARNQKGVPQPDEVIVEILRRKLAATNLENGIILDAYPISLGQTQYLEKIRKEFQLADPIVFFIVIDRWECVRRLTLRKFCLKCNATLNAEHDDYQRGICSNDGEKLITRDDDKFTVVKRRIEEYTFRMYNIQEYYTRKGWVININGQQPIDLVYQEIKEKLAAKRSTLP